jgi:hypothetical protein
MSTQRQETSKSSSPISSRASFYIFDPPLHSDPVPENKEELMGAAFGSVGPWLERHGDPVVQPLIKGVMEELRGDGEVKKIG